MKVHCGLFEQPKTCWNVCCYSIGSFSKDPKFTGILDGENFGCTSSYLALYLDLAQSSCGRSPHFSMEDPHCDYKQKFFEKKKQKQHC